MLCPPLHTLAVLWDVKPPITNFQSVMCDCDRLLEACAWSQSLAESLNTLSPKPWTLEFLELLVCLATLAARPSAPIQEIRSRPSFGCRLAVPSVPWCTSDFVWIEAEW